MKSVCAAEEAALSHVELKRDPCLAIAITYATFWKTSVVLMVRFQNVYIVAGKLYIHLPLTKIGIRRGVSVDEPFLCIAMVAKPPCPW